MRFIKNIMYTHPVICVASILTPCPAFLQWLPTSLEPTSLVNPLPGPKKHACPPPSRRPPPPGYRSQNLSDLPPLPSVGTPRSRPFVTQPGHCLWGTRRPPWYLPERDSVGVDPAGLADSRLIQAALYLWDMVYNRTSLQGGPASKGGCGRYVLRKLLLTLLGGDI